MNNTINNVSNISFNARYLNLKQLENVPPRISEAILKNEAIDKFLKEGKPKTLWEKFIDLFKKDQMLDVYHNTATEAKHPDPYAKDEFVYFGFGDSCYKDKSFTIRTSQNGIKREAGSIPKPGEHYLYKPPVKTSEDKLIEEIEKIDNFGKLLK